MTNKEIANQFNNLAKVMELHGENPYKIRSYANAYLQLRKLQTPLSDMSDNEIEALKGVGKTITAKIRELQETGKLETFQKYASVTPQGILELLKVKGFGPKKINVLWKELGVESVGELLYACNENRLVELKGFGHKTQEDLRKKLEYFQQSRNKFHFATLENVAADLLKEIRDRLPKAKVELVGEIARLCPVVERVEILIGQETINLEKIFDGQLLNLESTEQGVYESKTLDEIPVRIYSCLTNDFGSKQFRFSSAAPFIEAFLEKTKAKDFKNLATEEDVFEKAGIPFILPELRESKTIIDMVMANKLPGDLISDKAIKGVIHNHTTYSDGIHTLKEMATYTRDQGYEYIVITDHSQSAFYANGLKADRVLQQMEEIDALNKKLAPFKIFKSIESDILNDGSLDYEEDILKQFDLVIASVHSNLKMDEQKATQRLITAIENPYTTILGHPTGRLLLARKGYPIDHKKVIEACAAHNVVIELNANPHRLDLDWEWIPYALEKGVKIAINPDAHSKEGIHHIHYGVLAARKGGLTEGDCINTLSLSAFKSAYIK